MSLCYPHYQSQDVFWNENILTWSVLVLELFCLFFFPKLNLIAEKIWILMKLDFDLIRRWNGKSMFCLYVKIRMYWITIFQFVFQTSSFRKVATVCISSFAQTPPIRLWIHRGIWRKWMDGLRSLPGEKSVSVSHHSTPDILTRRVYKSALWSGLVVNFVPHPSLRRNWSDWVCPTSRGEWRASTNDTSSAIPTLLSSASLKLPPMKISGVGSKQHPPSLDRQWDCIVRVPAGSQSRVDDEEDPITSIGH